MTGTTAWKSPEVDNALGMLFSSVATVAVRAYRRAYDGTTRDMIPKLVGEVAKAGDLAAASHHGLPVPIPHWWLIISLVVETALTFVL